LRPAPTLADIRGSGMIKNSADNVLFIHQEQDIDTGWPNGDTSIYFGKARGGGLGGIEADFDGPRMTINERAPL
jgi:replicative DNA helicase